MIDFTQLDPVIHEKARLSIMTLLTTRSPRAFQDIKSELKLSDGNLITHLRTLTREKYVHETKATAADSARQCTSYEITASGQNAFQTYLKILEAIVRHTKYP